MKLHSKVLIGLAFAVTVAMGWSNVARAAAEDWNDSSIKWMSYEEGLKQAKTAHRPVCLIFYTTWCPHCANYSKVFSDSAVVEKSKSFVMVRLDKDKNPELSKTYSPDGEYIPRTYFLSPDGQLDPGLTEERPQYKYFYGEKDPKSLLAGMDRALKKLR